MSVSGNTLCLSQLELATVRPNSMLERIESLACDAHNFGHVGAILTLVLLHYANINKLFHLTSG